MRYQRPNKITPHEPPLPASGSLSVSVHLALHSLKAPPSYAGW